MTRYDDPTGLAELVAAQPHPMLLGLDVDGVLAPLVDHADDAVLLPGMGDAVSAAATLPEVHVAVISGRSVEGLARFEFGPDVHVIGSHGMETRDRPMAPLDDDESARLAELDAQAVAAADEAGEGAWVERKPASVVLHVRRAEPDRGRRALSALEERAQQVPGATSKAGSNVVELFARSADKGTALNELAGDLEVRTTVFVGDDVTDEEAFARLGADDVAIKVGDADTVAPHRLADPDAVLTWLQAVVQRIGGSEQ